MTKIVLILAIAIGGAAGFGARRYSAEAATDETRQAAFRAALDAQASKPS